MASEPSTIKGPCFDCIALELKARCFDGAKWSRRETPADPFQEVAK